jgi:hypothetical protein
LTQRLVNYKEIRSLCRINLVSSQAPLQVESKKVFFKQNHWRFTTKAKGLIFFAIIIVVLFSVFLVPSRKPGIIESAQTINSTVWKAVAADAWQYFQPGTGVDSNTGLPYAEGRGFAAFTDWDLGVYIQAVINAQKINLISFGESYSRLDKVLSFLETRELNSTTGYPYWFYDATTGKDYHKLSDAARDAVDAVDTGRLFVALNNLKVYNSIWAQRIDDFVNNVYGNRSDYAILVPSISSSNAASNSVYAYFVVSGFADFWPNQLADAPDSILSNIVNSPNVTTYNVALPKAPISCDPLLCSVFELNNNSSKLLSLAYQVYLAHEAYYNATNKYVAFSEGNGPSGYLWEWVVLPNGDTWKVQNQLELESSSYLGINPIIYNKVAFSFFALYSTTFSRSTVIYLEQNLPDPSNGYSDGADYHAGNNGGHSVTSVGSNTNGLILDAALYAIENNS